MAESQRSELFKDHVFAFVINRDLPISQAEDLQKTLEDHSATVHSNHDNIDLEAVTHIISCTSDFPKYAEAQLHMKPVVTPSWITQSLLKDKVALFRPFTPDPNLIFSNLNITCGDLPTGDKEAIIGVVLAMGGVESSSLTKLTTHICALTVDHPKCQNAIERGLKAKIVLPHWFDDCLKLGKRIDERPYLLPDPEIFRMGPEDDVALPSTDRLQGAFSSIPTTLPLPTESPVRVLSVFQNKKIMISTDLEISTRLRAILSSLISGGGGTVTTSVRTADMLVCHWRDGRDYVAASRAGIDVGNLSWLYYLITHNEWTSPLRRLLHYPLPRNGIPGFEEYRITLSNYGGEARTYLENLVIACGAEFTKSMKQDNTHLVTARKSSEKCNAAEEWNIEMMNHLWLEESYAKCEVQKLTDSRYTHFPPRTNLGEIIGNTQFDAEVLKSKYFPRDPTPDPDDPNLIKRGVMHEKDNNRPTTKKQMEDIITGNQVSNIDAIKSPIVRNRSKPAIDSEVKTPAPNRRISAGKENDTPSSTGSRSAKDKAISRLHGLAPDINLYEKEKKRKGPVWGGERAANNIEKEKSLERSSSPSTKTEEEEEFSEDEEESKHTSKRQKITGKSTSLPPVDIRLLVTSYPIWLGNPSKEDHDRKKLRELGILVVQDPATCTHLAAPSIVRTRKFLCALANGPAIVSAEFIEFCVKKGSVPNDKTVLLQDPANEKKFHLRLKDVILRAKANKRSLLRRVPIYCTEQISNGTDTYKAIVEANGGMFAVYRGRPTIKKVNPEDDEGPADPVYLLTSESPQERAMWPKFADMARHGNMIPRIVLSEWLLDVALSQQHKWEKRYLKFDDGL